MILVPDESWRWSFDEQRQKILLDLTDDMQFAQQFLQSNWLKNLHLQNHLP
jgi:hypothetical protein